MIIDWQDSKEAIDELTSGFLDTSDIEPYIRTIIDALEKQIPKKPRETRCALMCSRCGHKITEKGCKKLHRNYCKKCGQAIDWLESEVKVVPVVHGHWIKKEKYSNDSNVVCSECKMEFNYIDGVCYLVSGSVLPNYCPNCGAKMDKE